MLDTGRSPVPPQSLLPIDTLERMGDNLVAHCDSLGRLGLVDYQMGVSEEEIIDSKLMALARLWRDQQALTFEVVLNRCIDLLRTTDEDEDERAGGTTANQPPPRRNNR